jgi:hypothetical protein
MRYYLRAPVTKSLLPRRARVSAGFAGLVTFLCSTFAVLARSRGTRAPAVTLTTIAMTADETRDQAAAANEPPERLDPHQNLDGGSRLVRASRCSIDFFRQSQGTGS